MPLLDSCSHPSTAWQQADSLQLAPLLHCSLQLEAAPGIELAGSSNSHLLLPGAKLGCCPGDSAQQVPGA